MRHLLKKIALAVPQIRRLYSHVVKLSEELAAARAENDLLKRELDTLTGALESYSEPALQNELQSLQSVQARETMKVQLYVLRSDLNRAVEANELLRAQLREGEQLRKLKVE